jgi:DNA-binding protein YbaB
MNPQQIAQFQNQLLSIEETVNSDDHKISVSINGQCKIQGITFSDSVTIEQVKTDLPNVINQGLTQMGNKIKQLLVMQQQIR